MREKDAVDATLVGRPARREDGAVVSRISAISGPGQGRAIALVRATATIGRHATNDLALPDPRVSGVHAELTRTRTGVRVRDAGSTNGTWVGENRISDAELAIGTEIVVGDTVLRVDVDADGAVTPAPEEEGFGELVGNTPAMREIFATLRRIAPKPLTVLFQGEPGTGKEEMARALVALSPRATASFVVVDVTALPETMLDALVFGRARTATGGEEAGLLEAADGGTVFFDEVGALPSAAQAKLLRVLERRELVAAGAHVAKKVDVRVLSATSRDLRHDVEAGRFREDLYLRVAQMRVAVPPLRDRTDDIPLLCRKFLVRDGSPIAVDDDAFTELAGQPWPGNVRELKNALERASALMQGDTVRRADVLGEGFGFRGTREERGALDLTGTFKVAKDRAIERFESAYLSALMRRCGGNLSLAAREADLARHHLRDVLKKRALYGATWDKTDD